MVSIGSHVYVTVAKTAIRTVYGNSKGFEVKVSMHQGSALSHSLFVIAMEALSREFGIALPRELYTHHMVVIAKTEDDLLTGKRLNEWNDSMENRGMRVNMNKTEVRINGEWQNVTQKLNKVNHECFFWDQLTRVVPDKIQSRKTVICVCLISKTSLHLCQVQVLQLFNGPCIVSKTTWVSRYQKHKTRKVKPIWIYWSKR